MNNNILFYLILITFNCTYYYFTSSIIYLDDTDNTREIYTSVYSNNNIPYNYPNNESYTPYTYNYVETNQGYRVELEGDTNYNPELNTVPSNSGFTERIPHPSHYPPHNYINADTRIPHPSHYPPQDYLFESSNRDIFSIEPTESQIRDNGYYYHTGSKEELQKTEDYIPGDYGFLETMKHKMYNKGKELDKNLKDDYLKTLKRRIEVDKRRMAKQDFKQRVNMMENYIKKDNRKVSFSERADLLSNGYTIRNGKIKKL